LSHFIDFCIIWGVSWEQLWRQFCDWSFIWGAKVEGSFHVHLFNDLGMEMMPILLTIQE